MTVTMLSSRKHRPRIKSCQLQVRVTKDHSLLDFEDDDSHDKVAERSRIMNYEDSTLENNVENIINQSSGQSGIKAASMRQKLLNYKEAAIYLEEGADSEPLHLPWDRSVLTVLLLLHRKWFYAIDLLAAVCLLLLGFAESPSHPKLELPVVVHTGIEIGCLIVIMLVVLLKIRTRWSSAWGQKRDLAKLVLIITFLLEAAFVIVLKQPHLRLSRSLRPVFLIDNHHMTGLRRFLRQLFESLPPILDIMGLMMFMIIIYSVLGFYLLGPTQDSSGSPYFQSLTDSMVNLFVLLTTANFPDIMMPSYHENMAYTVFFISYLGINLYFLMNLMLTVVYKTFADVEEKKFANLITGKAEASCKAFELLKPVEYRHIDFSSFKGLMMEFQPFRGDIDTLLMWKFLSRNSDHPDRIDSSQFSQVYQAVNYRWSLVPDKEGPSCWYRGPSRTVRTIVTFLAWLVTSKGFEIAVYILVGLNTVLLVVQAGLIQTTDQDHIVYNPHVGMVFVFLYGAELLLKILGMGFSGYFSCPWNAFDFVVTSSSLVSIVLVFSSYDLEEHMSTIVVLRLVRVLRLFRMKKRFRDVFGTAVILFPHLVSTVIVLLLLYYFFAIIGLELFSSYNLLNCCKGTPIEPFYSHHPDPHAVIHGFYFMNNFNSLPEAGITLFELTVANNWSIIMEAYATVTDSGWSRLYFIVFYLFTLVVLTIVVAAILEAFLFRIQYKKALKKDDESSHLSVLVALSSSELLSLPKTLMNRTMFLIKYPSPTLDPGTNSTLLFKGDKRRSREELQHLLQSGSHGASGHELVL